MHVLAVHFEGEEQVFVGRVRIDAELGEVTEETLASSACSVREGVFGLGEECLDFGTCEVGHALIVRPNLPGFV